MIKKNTVGNIAGMRPVHSNEEDTLEPLQSYNFERLYTRSYRGTKQLNLSYKSTFTLTDDFIEVEPKTTSW